MHACFFDREQYLQLHKARNKHSISLEKLAQQVLAINVSESGMSGYHDRCMDMKPIH